MSMTREQMNTITDFVDLLCKQTMRHDLEMKMANARTEDERQMYMRMMEAM